MRLYVGGAFDMLHTSHVEFLRRVSELGEVWVGLSADGYNYLDRVPVMNHEERRRPLEGLSYVTNIESNTGPPNTKTLLKAINPAYVVHTDDISKESLLQELGVDEEWLTDQGIGIMHLSYGEVLFSQGVYDRIEQSILPQAAQLPAA